MEDAEVRSVNEPSAVDSKATEKRVLNFALRAGLFWNHGPLVQVWVTDEGVFYHHNSVSNAEQFFEFLRSIGVLVAEPRRHRLAVRLDALSGYAAFLVDQGLAISTVLDALVALGGGSWLNVTRDPFEPTYYDDLGGDAAFDTRPLMIDLATLGYAEKIGSRYRWTEKMQPSFKANFF